MSDYDYESYFSNPKKLDYWNRKKVLDKKYLAPFVDSKKYTLNAGSGLFVEKDILKIKNIVCADISKTAVKKLSSSGIKAVKVDLKNNWPFKNQEFEQILLLDVFEHLGQVDFFLKELFRVLKKDGVVVLGIPLLNHWRNYLKLIFMGTNGVQYDEHPRMFFDKDIKQLFSNAGFVLEKIKYIGLTKGYGYYLFKKK